VEAPCSGREANKLREVFAAAYSSDAEKSVALINAVEGLGLRPFDPPPPLPPIELSEVHLVCWLAVEALGTPDLAGVGK
jgi:hypothetical protein